VGARLGGFERAAANGGLPFFFLGIQTRSHELPRPRPLEGAAWRRGFGVSSVRRRAAFVRSIVGAARVLFGRRRRAEGGGRTRAASAFAGGRSAGDGAHRHSAHEPRPGGVQGVGLWEELVNVLRKDVTSRPRRRLRPPQEGPARPDEHPRRLPRTLPRPRPPQEVQVWI